MKRVKHILVVILLFGTINVIAGNDSDKNDISKSVTILKYNKVKEGNKIIVKDSLGAILYNESILIDGKYIKGFNLTSLPEGNYSFELDKEFEIQVKPFKISNGNIKFLKKENHTIFKPVIRKKNGLVYLQNLSFNEDVKIEILSKKDYSLLHSEVVANALELRKVYDFSNLPSNDYIVIISTKNRKFKNQISL